ncbi:Gfo/Idh/MocA family oxidoreductase [Enterocloster bolteae]|uniref:Gfo/Idh/MocA family oxidoreductase n=1 Tax=Enterocloster bolteae TaxID=208479 RepID=UPI0028DC1F1A|nr:Gfo/Idh/MocA family oxidoreductase [Enterocloster bolteae]
MDCAFVLTPKACHAEQIFFLLKAGVDVYSEKTMATTPEAVRIFRCCNIRM